MGRDIKGASLLHTRTLRLFLLFCFRTAASGFLCEGFRYWAYKGDMTGYTEHFAVHVTVHHDNFCMIKPTTYTNFSNLFLEWNSTCFGQFLCPSSGVFHCTHSNGTSYSCQHTSKTYTVAVCTVKNSWWWTEELSKTFRVSFQNKFEKLVHLVDFIIRNLSRCTVTWTSNLNLFLGQNYLLYLSPFLFR